MKKLISFPLVGAAALALAACDNSATADAETNAAEKTTAADPITADDVAAAQQAWGEGIVAIGRAFTEEGDYRTAAQEHIASFYGFDTTDTLLFKPTLAAEDQFRGNPEEALSYFVGTEGSEDGGFAIKPYTSVRWENEGTFIDDDGDTAMAMGNYYFTDTEGAETKVEYSFGYVRGEDGELDIVLHHSSLPYSAS